MAGQGTSSYNPKALMFAGGSPQVANLKQNEVTRKYLQGAVKTQPLPALAAKKKAAFTDAQKKRASRRKARLGMASRGTSPLTKMEKGGKFKVGFGSKPVSGGTSPWRKKAAGSREAAPSTAISKRGRIRSMTSRG